MQPSNGAGSASSEVQSWSAERTWDARTRPSKRGTSGSRPGVLKVRSPPWIQGPGKGNICQHGLQAGVTTTTK
eukprot:12662372-Alexandrium_andersonii.AAC.1